MKSKRLLRFYFKAEELDGALNNLITAYALKSYRLIGGGEHYAQRICELIRAKVELGKLWRYLNGVMRGLENERETLRKYAMLRCGIRRFSAEEQKKFKRALVKFARHATLIQRYCKGAELVDSYYCLI